ncbi:MAG: carbamoyltransferase HypF [Euryarchaeota archaeon]|nr:carbamoyltransferase HypF [Euryarchaeota archaeon]
MYRIIVRGIVQGVGFRPFVYRTAKKNNLRGYVRNAANSVEILIDGKESDVRNFLKNLKNEHPPLAEIFSVNAKYAAGGGEYDDFYVLKSESMGETDSVIPPDVAICEKCREEIFDKDDRRYLYPFTVCTDCGPRFTIIEALPYDRERTTMKEFAMCKKCATEYSGALDRRFRAEPTCCEKCGPRYGIFKGNKKLSSENPIKAAAEALDSGAIVAIKGVGGTHLATKTTEDEAVLEIRKILNRPQKPFAIMARDVEAVEKIACLSKREKKLLTSFRRPIVLLKKKNNLSEHIAPGLHNVGIMLPYAGIHHLLFYYSREPAFVMTSANVPGEPMVIENEEILTLNPEYSLVHDRRIKNRCDDSVIKFVDGKAAFLRRSRGFVPLPIKLKIENEKNILALGAELDVTACLLKGSSAFISQYVGNTTKLKTLEYLEAAIYNLIELTKVEKIDAVAVDLHPGFNTVQLGAELSKKFDAKLIKCQHHHAHIASLMAESGVEKIVGISCDGIGYGTDGKVWGGEILVSSFSAFERTGSLMPQIMPGGDLAANKPARMVAGILSKKYSVQELRKILTKNCLKGFKNEKEIEIVLKQIERRCNTPETTSAGRVLDAIAALLNVCYGRTYEGEPAMKLEAFALKGKPGIEIPAVVKKFDGRYILDTAEIIDAVLEMKEEFKYEDVAASAQKAMAKGLAEIAVKAIKKNAAAGFSGGVAYNDAIVRCIRTRIEKEGLKFLTQTKAPCGDGGISLGQAAVVSHLISSTSQ